MKKITLILAMILVAFSTTFAQADAKGIAEKNAGNAAIRAKNYKEAFTKLEAYLKIVKFQDKAYLYNTAYCAYKSKDYNNAVKYYKMAIKERYKLASSYKGVANSYKALKKNEEYIKTLEEGLKAVPDNVSLTKSYFVYYMKVGQSAQNAKNTSIAIKNYMKIAEMGNKEYKAQGLMSLATLYFNNGAEVMQKVTPFANKDKAKYEEGKKSAKSDFVKAQTFCDQARDIEPANKDIKTLSSQIATAMKNL